MTDKPISAEEFADHLCLFNRGETVALIKARDAALSATQGVPDETLKRRVEAALSNVNEFGHPTDECYWDALIDCAEAFVKAPTNGAARAAAPDMWQDDLIIHSELCRLERELGSQRAVANKLNFSPSFINDVLQHKREVSESLAAALGFKRFVGFIAASNSQSETQDGEQ